MFQGPKKEGSATIREGATIRGNTVFDLILYLHNIFSIFLLRVHVYYLIISEVFPSKITQQKKKKKNSSTECLAPSEGANIMCDRNEQFLSNLGTYTEIT